ncbi:MAG: S-methylmethionine-dependent homocysteine/selenocysteine methylase [Myxococcota bacterium]|jgi:S-methylmethionine-dependent homocysteine/selenocysteine methylase
MRTPPVTLLDGPIGTELISRGVPTSGVAWTAWAASRAPDTLAAVHAEYAHAGAVVHTANTFRTTPSAVGGAWRSLAERSVAVARSAVPPSHRIAGAIAPVHDCYRPDLSPPNARAHHRRTAAHLAGLGVDLLLCETFAHVDEAIAAVEACVATRVPTWLALTAGPDADLLTHAEVRAGAARAVAVGARAILINCVPADRTLPFVEAIADLGVPFGAYANGWPSPGGSGPRNPSTPASYAVHARSWRAAGATLIGGCCGTGPAHVRELMAM